MPTVPTELQDSRVTRITGQEETYAADVINSDKNRLCVDASISGHGGLVPALTKKYRAEWLTSPKALGGVAYELVYEYVGTGYLHGYHLESSTDKVQYRMVVDGETLFDNLQPKYLKHLGLEAAARARLQQGSGPVAADGDEFDFSLRSPLKFDQHIRVYGKTDKGSSFSILRYLFQITKNT